MSAWEMLEMHKLKNIIFHFIVRPFRVCLNILTYESINEIGKKGRVIII
tara:strand:+ start:96 stop:242 length:147 start_codon:yes stop_codon:yes gene_type:complete